MDGTATIVMISVFIVVGAILGIGWSLWKGKKVLQQEQRNSVDVEEQIMQNAQQQEQHNSVDVETQTTQNSQMEAHIFERVQPLNLNNFSF